MPDLDVRTDLMQVCRNGHVVTDRLRADPRSGATHCDRCGADTVHQCETCGQELAGVPQLLGMTPIGVRRPPQFCSSCGAAFPWDDSRRPAPLPGQPLELVTLLRRLPLVVRQLRFRHENRPPFRVEDQLDLQDLLRALLPLCCQEVRPEQRTPSYATRTQTDFFLMPARIALVAKRTVADDDELRLGAQVKEDVAYYREREVRSLVIFVHDPMGAIRDAKALEAAWARLGDELRVRCVIAG